MECSLIPKCMFLPFGNSPMLFSIVLFEGPRSALPPTNPGIAFAMAFRIFPLLSLVATPLPASKVGHSILSKFGFSRAIKASFCSLSGRSKSSLPHCFSKSSPLGTASKNCSFTSSGIKNFLSGSNPALFLDSLISSSPSGAPCV